MHTRKQTQTVLQAAVTAVVPVATGRSWWTTSLFWVYPAQPIRRQPQWNTPLSHQVQQSFTLVSPAAQRTTTMSRMWYMPLLPRFHTSIVLQIDWWIKLSKATLILHLTRTALPPVGDILTVMLLAPWNTFTGAETTCFCLLHLWRGRGFCGLQLVEWLRFMKL